MTFITKFFKILITNNNKNLDTISKKIEATVEKTSKLKLLQQDIHILQQQLIENQNKLNSIITTVTDAIVVLNIKGEVILWNTAAETMFQYTIDEVQASGLNNIIMGLDDFKSYTNKIDNLKTEFVHNKNISITNTLVLKNAVKKDGTVFPVEISITPWRNNGDLYFTAIIRDLNKRQKTLKKLYTLETINSLIIRNTSDGIAVYDLNLKVLLWNPVMEKITGILSQDIIGKNIYDVFPDLKNSKTLKIFDIVLSRTEKKDSLTLYQNKDSEKKYIKRTFSPLYNINHNKIIGIVEVVRIFSHDEIRIFKTIKKIHRVGKR